LNNKCEGFGELYYASGEIYEGYYANNKREGHGILKYVNGKRYEGNFVKDKKEGDGVEYNKDGTIKRKGEWKEGKFVGTKLEESQMKLD
jgi:hypothetical protein